jgi:uncharacterized membrane protein
MNMFGWYVASDMDLNSTLRMLGFGVVVQAVPRLVGLPVLAHYFAKSQHAQHVASMLLFITACRNIYAASTMEFEDPQRPCRNAAGARWVSLPLLLRFAFAELSDLVGNADGFFAKVLVTRNTQLISISGLVAILLPRASNLLLLGQRKSLQSRQHFALRAMLFLSGVMVLIFVAHTNFPRVPDIPIAVKLIIVVALYGFLFYIGYKHIDERTTGRDSENNLLSQKVAAK